MSTGKKEYHRRYYLENKAELLEKHRVRNKRSPRYALTSIIAQAKKRAETTIDQQYLLDVYDQQQGLCALSGVKMTWATGRTCPTSISVDRIDQSLGYVDGNVRLVCVAVNAFRSTMNDQELLVFARTLVSNMEAKAAVLQKLKEFA
jgi:hypothetical protein